MKKKLILIILTGLLVFSACNKEKVTSVILNKNEIFLSVGDTETLIATVEPDDADNKKVKWKSNNTDVATISDKGLVTAIKDGKATITVTTKDGKKTAACVVMVDYRGKWVGDYIGEDIYWVSQAFPGGGTTTYDTTINYVVNVSIWQDSCLLFKPGYAGLYPKINSDGCFQHYFDRMRIEGFLKNDSLIYSESCRHSQSFSNGSYFKGKKL